MSRLNLFMTAFLIVVLVMLSIFMQHYSCKHVFTSGVENGVDPDQMSVRSQLILVYSVFKKG